MMEVYCFSDNKVYDVSTMVQSGQIKGSKYKTARSLNISLLNTDRGLHSSFSFEEGQLLVFKWNKDELFRGDIHSIGKDKTQTDTILAYDSMIYLLNNYESYVFENKKASEIAQKICSDFGIEIGTIADTGYVIPLLVFDGSKNAYDIMMQALELTRKQIGVNHYIYSMEGKFNLIKRVEQLRKWVIEDGCNLIDYSYKSSIENTFTKVKLVHEENDTTIIATAENGDLQKKFGMIQYFEKVTDSVTQAQLNERAKATMSEKGVKSKTLSLTALGITDVISGSAIHVIEENLNIAKGFFVDEDTHSFKGNEHIMDLKLEETDTLPEVTV